jgi:hypothetical protein
MIRLFFAALALPASVIAQQPLAATQPAPPPPATKLEAFKPAAGTLSTMGYHEEGRAGCCVSVDAREFRDAKGNAVRGLVVDVRESEYRSDRAFVDVDEIPELVKGVDALLGVKENPTKYPSFEVSYKTRGELKITAFNNNKGEIGYAVEAGRVVPAHYFLDPNEMQKFRDLLAQAQQDLASK